MPARVCGHLRRRVVWRRRLLGCLLVVGRVAELPSGRAVCGVGVAPSVVVAVCFVVVVRAAVARLRTCLRVYIARFEL